MIPQGVAVGRTSFVLELAVPVAGALVAALLVDGGVDVAGKFVLMTFVSGKFARSYCGNQTWSCRIFFSSLSFSGILVRTHAINKKR